MKDGKYSIFGLQFLALTRFRIALLLVFFLVASSSIGFAIWDETSPIRDDTQIIIGEGTTFEVYRQVVDPDESKTLVPLGAFRGANDVHYYMYTYEIVVNKPGVLTIDKGEVLIGETDTHSHLMNIEVALSDGEAEFSDVPFDVTFTHEGEYFDVEEEVYSVFVDVRVSMEAPESNEQYEAIARQTMSFEIVFSITELDEE